MKHPELSARGTWPVNPGITRSDDFQAPSLALQEPSQARPVKGGSMLLLLGFRVEGLGFGV